MPFKDALMQVISRQFVDTEGEREFGGVESKTEGRYYLKNLNDNLFEPLSPAVEDNFGGGSGNELKFKMKALRSSSAMTFNILGNGPAVLKENAYAPAGTYDVTYEYNKMRPLKSRSQPANLDALLVRETSAQEESAEIYCEMKMTEWLLNRSSRLKDAYLHADNYDVPQDAADVFVQIFKTLCTDRSPKDGTWKCCLSRYDAFQMAKHLLAIYTSFTKRKNEGGSGALPDRCALINCVWELEHPEKLGKFEKDYRKRLAEEHEQRKRFDEIVAPACKLFEALGVKFKLDYISTLEFASMLKLTAQHREYLERYRV